MADLPLSKSGKSVQKCPKKKLRALRPVKPSFFCFLMDEPWALRATLFWPNLFFLSDSLWRYSCLWWSETVIQNTFNSSFLYIKPKSRKSVKKKTASIPPCFFCFLVWKIDELWALRATLFWPNVVFLYRRLTSLTVGNRHSNYLQLFILAYKTNEISTFSKSRECSELLFSGSHWPRHNTSYCFIVTAEDCRGPQVRRECV